MLNSSCTQDLKEVEMKKVELQNVGEEIGNKHERQNEGLLK